MQGRRRKGVRHENDALRPVLCASYWSQGQGRVAQAIRLRRLDRRIACPTLAGGRLSRTPRIARGRPSIVRHHTIKRSHQTSAMTREHATILIAEAKEN